MNGKSLPRLPQYNSVLPEKATKRQKKPRETSPAISSGSHILHDNTDTLYRLSRPVGKFTRDKMAKPFSDAAFALAVGESSGAVETPFGFHVIKRNQ